MWNLHVIYIKNHCILRLNLALYTLKIYLICTQNLVQNALILDAYCRAWRPQDPKFGRKNWGSACQGFSFVLQQTNNRWNKALQVDSVNCHPTKRNGDACGLKLLRNVGSKAITHSGFNLWSLPFDNLTSRHLGTEYLGREIIAALDIIQEVMPRSQCKERCTRLPTTALK